MVIFMKREDFVTNTHGITCPLKRRKVKLEATLLESATDTRELEGQDTDEIKIIL
jgi:hypothetical protein